MDGDVRRGVRERAVGAGVTADGIRPAAAMRRGPSTRAVAAMWAVAGLLAATVALRHTLSAGAPTATVIAFAAVFGVLMAAGCIWPITLYVAESPDAIDVDEGFFVLLVLLVPASLTVLVFAVAMVVALRSGAAHWPWSAFNVGRVVTSVGLGALVFAFLHGSARASPGYAKVGAALAGAVVLLRRQHRRHGRRSWRPWALLAPDGVRGARGQAPRRRRAASASPSRPACCSPITRVTCPSPCCPCWSCAPWATATSTPGTTGPGCAASSGPRSTSTAPWAVEETRAAVLASAGSLLRSPDVSLTSEPPGRRGARRRPMRGRRPHPLARGRGAEPDRALRRRPTGRCSRHWLRSAPSPWPTPSSTPRSASSRRQALAHHRQPRRGRVRHQRGRARSPS